MAADRPGRPYRADRRTAPPVTGSRTRWSPRSRSSDRAIEDIARDAIRNPGRGLRTFTAAGSSWSTCPTAWSRSIWAVRAEDAAPRTTPCGRVSRANYVAGAATSSGSAPEAIDCIRGLSADRARSVVRCARRLRRVRMGDMITVEHLTKRYGDYVALDDVSFTSKPDGSAGFHRSPTAPGNRRRCASSQV